MKNVRLIELREQQGLTQQQLAEVVGLSQGMIAHIESGKRSPSWKFRVKLARHFNVSVEWLFFEQTDCNMSYHPAATGTEGR